MLEITPVRQNGSSSAAQLTPVTIHERLQGAMNALEARMYDVVNSDVVVLRDASRHIITAGGKRLRPRLLFLTYMALGGRDELATIDVAAAVELVHTASVVHDDINDHGIMRRGRPSVNSVWGRTFALLTGDFLFTKVYELMAPHGDLNIALAEGTVALVEGETLQASAVKEGNFSRAVYYDIIARKTAALFRSAAQMGAQMANASSEQIEAFRQFGFNIGLAFQIIDDVLDVVGDEAKLGKTAHIDVAQGRGITMATDTPNADDPMDSIKRKMMEGDTIVQAQQKARALVDMAISHLSILPDSEAKEELVALALATVEREL